MLVLGKLPHLGAGLAKHAVCSREKVPRVSGPILADGGDAVGTVLNVGKPFVGKYFAGVLEGLIQNAQQVLPLAPRNPVPRSGEKGLFVR